MRILGGAGHNSGKTVLNILKFTEIQSRETSEQTVTVIKMTSNQSIGSHKGRFMCQMSSESLKIPDVSKTALQIFIISQENETF